MPRSWMIFLGVLLGAMAGVGITTFHYAAGLSSRGNDPAACVNCHIMRDEYDAWRKGPHHAFATCNDCHVPPHFPQKYVAKALNGYHHSTGFTFQPSRPDVPGAKLVFEEPIRIKAKNSQVPEENRPRLPGAFGPGGGPGSPFADDAIRCVHCHRG